MINLKDLAIQYFLTFSSKNLTNLMTLFTDNPTLRDWNGLAEGRTDVESANKNIFDNVDTITVTPLSLHEDGNTVAAEIEVLINGTEKLLVVDVITFEGDRIASIRAYKG